MADDADDADDAIVDDGRSTRYRRRDSELEFDRVAFFSDAVFAIAMTLLVVGIGIPRVRDANLDHALKDKRQEIISFFLSFVVIGYYWLAHHRFFAQLKAVDTQFMRLNLLYLAAIAFTPFPTALAGIYSDHAISIVIYAVTLGVASFMETMMLWRAYHVDLLRRPMTAETFRYNFLAALAPVIVFAASIPLAYVDTTWALLSWLLIFPLEILIGRRFSEVERDPYM